MPRPRSERKYKAGQRFGMLTVIGPAEDAIRSDGSPCYTYRCRCDCGRERTVREPSLTYGRAKSCGHHSHAGEYGTKAPNDHRIAGGVCYIKLRGGAEAMVDADDYPEVSRYRWHRDDHGYAVTATYGSLRKIHGQPRLIKMHSIIMGRRNIDHVNGNPLDNRRANLRPFDSPSENAINKDVSSKSKTGYFGVYRRSNGSYCAKLQWKGEQIHLGTFENPEDAARARDAKVLELCGGFGRLNFPDD